VKFRFFPDWFEDEIKEAREQTDLHARTMIPYIREDGFNYWRKRHAWLKDRRAARNEILFWLYIMAADLLAFVYLFTYHWP
jgi:hypothetical protein